MSGRHDSRSRRSVLHKVAQEEPSLSPIDPTARQITPHNRFGSASSPLYIANTSPVIFSSRFLVGAKAACWRRPTSLCSPCTRSEVPPARPQSPGYPRSRVSSVRSRLLRSRLLLAPSHRVPVHHHTCHSQGILADQVPCQREPGQAQPEPSARSRMEGGDCLGMRATEAR